MLEEEDDGPLVLGRSRERIQELLCMHMIREDRNDS